MAKPSWPDHQAIMTERSWPISVNASSQSSSQHFCLQFWQFGIEVIERAPSPMGLRL